MKSFERNLIDKAKYLRLLFVLTSFWKIGERHSTQSGVIREDYNCRGIYKLGVALPKICFSYFGIVKLQ